MIRLAELLDVDRLDLSLVACMQASETWIHWVHRIDDVRDVDRLRGRELVVSSGRWSADSATADRFACALTRRGAAALGVSFDSEHLGSGVIAACERWRLPLIEIRPPTTCDALSETAASLIVARRGTILSESVQRERLFASTSASGVQGTLDVLQRGIQHPVYLVTRGAVHVASGGSSPRLGDIRLLSAACTKFNPIVEVL